jgi:chemotaxis protein MotB
MKKNIVWVLGIFVLTMMTSGCAAVNRYKRAGELEEENAELRSKLDEAKEEKVSALEQARRDLAKAFEKELGEYKAKLEMTERGLVITFLAEVFFDPGKDVVLSDGKLVLDKIAKVLNKDVADSRVAVEGHTDSDPIRVSGWKSNWELSSARALAVLHYFADDAKVKSDRLSANAYGEFSPIASNDTAAGKKKNRRVEIVILPSAVSKVKASE